MLNNVVLNRRINKLFRVLKKKWGIATHRVAVESGIPYASLNYMKQERFDWKLNHLLAIIGFLKRYGVKTSLSDLLDFNGKKSFDQIFDLKKANFSVIVNRIKQEKAKKYVNKKSLPEKKKEINPVREIETILFEIGEVVKENLLYKNNKIVVGVKISGKNYNYQKEIKF
jgi:hypothetical protein